MLCLKLKRLRRTLELAVNIAPAKPGFRKVRLQCHRSFVGRQRFLVTLELG